MAVAQSSEVVASGERRNEAAEAVSKELDRVSRVVKVRISSSIREVVVEAAEADVLAGATMTSHSETEILQSQFGLAGR